MYHQRTVCSGTAVIAAAGVAVSAAACGGSSPSNASPSPSVRYYQEGYRYARANIGPSEHRILSHAGYSRWCASATAATSELSNVSGGSSSKAATHWVKGCDAYAASVGLSATASPAPAPPPATTVPATQPAPPTPAPSSPASPNGVANPNAQPSSAPPPPSAPAPSQPAPYCDPSTGICQHAPAPPPGGYPGGSQNPCNGPNASEFGDCVPGGGINGGRPITGPP